MPHPQLGVVARKEAGASPLKGKRRPRVPRSAGPSNEGRQLISGIHSATSDPHQSAVTNEVETSLVAHLLRGSAPHRILDLGCGRGRLAAPLQAQSAHYVGVDIDPTVLRELIATAANPRGINVVRASASRLPFRDGVFDVVVAIRVYHRIASPSAFLEETNRVLRPRGRHCLQFGPNPSLGTWERAFWRALRGPGHQPPLESGPRSLLVDRTGSNPGYLEPGSRTSKRVQDAGFSVEETRHHGLETIPVLRRVPPKA